MSVSPSILTSDHFAVILGFAPENPVDATQLQLPLPFVPGHEMVRHANLKIYVNAFARGGVPETQQDQVWSKFCARHLPETVEKFLNLPPALDDLHPDDQDVMQDYPASNAYLEILIQIQHLPYLYKYVRSTKEIAAPGKRLPQVLAERLAERLGRWDVNLRTLHTRDPQRAGFYNSAAACALQLLNTLCVYLIRTDDRSSVIDRQTQRALTPVLTRWAARYNGELLGDVSVRMLGWMAGSTQFIRHANKVRRAAKGWEVCGLPECNAHDDLRACKRCQTVRYCCTDHQKRDWSSATGSKHKLVCFETEY
ncbi:hypothetical protein C8F01DRAFT_1101375 [Mycena amicta]|nr:hypothetical protein C8F01DRAFT_1101375 [Mycena amicta]